MLLAAKYMSHRIITQTQCVLRPSQLRGTVRIGGHWHCAQRPAGFQIGTAEFRLTHCFSPDPTSLKPCSELPSPFPRPIFSGNRAKINQKHQPYHCSTRLTPCHSLDSWPPRTPALDRTLPTGKSRRPDQKPPNTPPQCSPGTLIATTASYSPSSRLHVSGTQNVPGTLVVGRRARQSPTPAEVLCRLHQGEATVHARQPELSAVYPATDRVLLSRRTGGPKATSTSLALCC